MFYCCCYCYFELEIGIYYNYIKVEYVSDFLKDAGVERDESQVGIREGRGTVKYKFKCLLEKEATEDYKVVAIVVLRLHP